MSGLCGTFLFISLSCFPTYFNVRGAGDTGVLGLGSIADEPSPVLNSQFSVIYFILFYSLFCCNKSVFIIF